LKSNTKKLDLQSIGKKITEFFSPSVEIIARQTKFVQRNSPLNGLNYLKIGVFGFLENPGASLNDLAQVSLDLGIKVTPQGMDERINPFSVAFMRSMFHQAIEVFKSQIPLALPALQLFTAINIVDSTVKELPDSMVTEYPGCGGNGPMASMKIQLVFEFLRGNLKQVALQAGRAADHAYQDYLMVVEQGSLNLMDLGYFCLDAFREIANKGAYFLSRYLYPTALLTPEGKRIDLVSLLQQQTAETIEHSILLGNPTHYRLPCRLVILHLPLAVAEERRRKTKARAAKRGETLTAKYLFLLGWTIFLTNAPVTLLSLEQVACLYRVRWQIELIFKLWKSYCGLKHIAHWRRERVLTELYTKMIGIILIHFLVAPLRIPDEGWSGREISTIQVRKVVARYASRLNQSLSDDESDFIIVLRRVIDQIVRFGFKQKRRKNPNVCQRLASSSLA